MSYNGSVLDTGTATNGAGYAEGSAAQAGRPEGMLPRQADKTNYLYSLARDTQVQELLGAGLNAAVGRGVITATAVEETAALSVKIPAGARFFWGGVVFRLLVDAVFNAVAFEGSTVLWVNLTRTPADPTVPTRLDTYALEVGTGPFAPTATAIPYAVITSVAGAITDIDEDPNGKYLAKRTVEVIATVMPGEVVDLSVDHSDLFVRFDVGHTRIRSVDQPAVTVTIDPDLITEIGFPVRIQNDFAMARSPDVGDAYGDETEIRVLIECWGRFYDLTV